MADVLILKDAINDATEAVGRLAQEAKALYGEAVCKGEGLTEADLPERLRRRLMPEGMEWPCFGDGEPVRFGDRIRLSSEFRDGVKGIELLADGRYRLHDSMYDDSARVTFFRSERVKRPEPPEPKPDPDNLEFWRKLRRKEVALTACGYCDRYGIDYDGDSDAIAKMTEEFERRMKELDGKGK